VGIYRRQGHRGFTRKAFVDGGVALLVLLALALAVRVAAIGATHDYKPFGDAVDYDKHAAVLDFAQSYPQTGFAAPHTATAFRPPAYPYLLAGVYGVTASRWTVGRLAGAALGVLGIALLFLIAYAVWGRRIALWSAGFGAVFPPLVLLSTGLLAENLFLPVMLGALACTFAARRSSHAWRWSLAAGTLCGLAALTRGNGLLLLIPVGMGLATVRPGRGARALLAPAVAAAAALVVLIPWTLRNADVFHRFLPLGTEAGFTIAGTYNAIAAKDDKFQGLARYLTDVPEYRPLLRQPEVNEAELSSDLGQKGFHYLRHHLGYFATVVRLAALRSFDVGKGHAFRSAQHWDEMGIPHGWRWWLRWSLYLTLALAAGGLVVLWRSGARGPPFLWLAPVIVFLGSIWVVGGPRYRAPLDPFIALLAGMALAAIVGRLRPVAAEA
jgi:4-amino-4-deoxy-L-arabinose transferase-like glycosyltransferase